MATQDLAHRILANLILQHDIHDILAMLKSACIADSIPGGDARWDHAIRTNFEQITGNSKAAWGVKDDDDFIMLD